MSNAKIDRVEDAFFYSPYVSTNLLKTYRCVYNLIQELSGKPEFKVEHDIGMPTKIRKQFTNLNIFNTTNEFYNCNIGWWKITGINENSKKILRSDYREIAITAFKINV